MGDALDVQGVFAERCFSISLVFSYISFVDPYFILFVVRTCILLLDEIEGCDREAVDALVKLSESKDKKGNPKIKRYLRGYV